MMTKKSITRSLVIIAIIALIYWPIRFATLICLWLQYGESAQGSIDSENAYQFFPIRHLPMLLPVILLAYQSVRFKLWTNDKEKLKSNILAVICGLILYFLFEKFEVFDGS